MGSKHLKMVFRIFPHPGPIPPSSRVSHMDSSPGRILAICQISHVYSHFPLLLVLLGWNDPLPASFCACPWLSRYNHSNPWCFLLASWSWKSFFIPLSSHSTFLRLLFYSDLWLFTFLHVCLSYQLWVHIYHWFSQNLTLFFAYRRFSINVQCLIDRLEEWI